MSTDPLPRQSASHRPPVPTIPTAIPAASAAATAAVTPSRDSSSAAAAWYQPNSSTAASVPITKLAASTATTVAFAVTSATVPALFLRQGHNHSGECVGYAASLATNAVARLVPSYESS